MQENIIPLLQCPECQGLQLKLEVFKKDRDRDIKEGVVTCRKCQSWYQIEDYVLEFLPTHLAYREDRKRFFKKYKHKLKGLHSTSGSNNQSPQREQQEYFDWYANNEKQSYTSYAESTFWKSVDALIFGEWKKRIAFGSHLLDVGCAQGRSAFLVADLPIDITAFDISKKMVREAVVRYKKKKYRATMSFLVADATYFPFSRQSFDCVLLYGVLHHLADPALACRHIARVLRTGGLYFGLENHTSLVRVIFDLFQKLYPIWYEKAGSKPLMNEKDITTWFKNTGMSIHTSVQTFVPPHVINILPRKFATNVLIATNSLGTVLGLTSFGGLLVIEGSKNVRS